jgi:hypothetical protein
MNRRALTVLPVCAAILAAGCSSNAKQAAASPATTVTAGPYTDTPTPAANLTAELLTVDDLPAGWTTTTPGSSSGSDPSCAALSSGAWKHLPQRAQADFQNSGGDVLVTEKLAAGSADQVSQAWTAFGAATSQCRTFTNTIDGHTVTYRLQDLSFPSYGEKTYAFAMTATVSVVTVNADIIVVRKGNTLVEILAMAENTGVPVDVAEQATSKAVGRVK